VGHVSNCIATGTGCFLAGRCALVHILAFETDLGASRDLLGVLVLLLLKLAAVGLPALPLMPKVLQQHSAGSNRM
jgi:hypothetical protein